MIKEIIKYGEAEVTYKSKTEKSEQIVSKSTTDKMRELMDGAINNTWTPGYTYSVKGYTREDGTKVQGYTRDCHKHKGSVPKLDNLSFEELERWIKELI